MKFCPKCGGKLDSEALSCESCGANLSKRKTSKEKIAKTQKPSKSKGFLKKGLKGLSKVAGDMVGDKLSELTDDENIGAMAGKIVKTGKGSTIILNSQTIEQKATSNITNAIKIQANPLPISINITDRLLGSG